MMKPRTTNGMKRVRVRYSNTRPNELPLLNRYPETKKKVVRKIGAKKFITLLSHIGRCEYMTIINAIPRETSSQPIRFRD